ncbi:hypothetical protein M758_1G182500 [Ceratodon purpureus]|nr:hypothetical protein M758_1G182500 [Ceratodon purpureus]
MTDVVIQHLITEEKVRIRCRDYIKKIAVYQERVAVQLSNRIVVYELSKAGTGARAAQYRVCAKINRTLECNLLVLTSEHITLCQETKLQLLSFDGIKEREWLLESTIRYIKVCGGPRGGEGLLIGMKNGLIVKVWINSNFPIRLYKHTTGIRCLDLSSRRVRLAIVDEAANVVVYDIETKEISFEEKSASSVAWNTNMEDMLCYSGSGMLNIKTADFPVHRQKLQGYVVGFQGSKIFCLNQLSMQTIEVPQSTSMCHYVEKGQYEDAYKVACLGVTEADWRMLALAALKGSAWDVAKKGFIRLRDVCYLDLLHRLEQGHCSHVQKSTLGALVLAYQGKFKEAADAYIEAGQVSMAMEMYTDLRMFEEAKALAETTVRPEVNDITTTTPCRKEADVQEIIQRQAEWTEEAKDHETAADMYLAAGQAEKALALLVKHGPASKLIEVARRLKKTQVKELMQCATLMKRGGQFAHAFETYTKLGDFRSILSLHVELEQWDDAFAIKRLHPEIEDDVALPYAQWLINHDRYDHARLAYSHAGRPDLSERLLTQLMDNALKEKRFKDGARLCRKLAMEALAQVAVIGKTIDPRKEKLKFEEYVELRQRADILYGYSFIYQSINEPFRTSMPETLFNISRFLLARIPEDPPRRVSLVNILVTLAKHSEQLGFYKISRHAYERLQKYKVPQSWVDKVEVATLMMRGKARRPDDPKMDLPICYACSSPFSMTTSSTEDACSNCSQPIFRSFITYDQLPLVEFILDESISHEQAMLLSAASPASNNSYINHNPLELGQQRASKPGPIVATKAMLSNLQASQLLVQTCPAQYERSRYFYAVDPTLAVTQCSSCNHFFEQEEMDLAMLEFGYCPFCGVPPSSLPASNPVSLPSSLGGSLGEHAEGNLQPLPPLPSARKDLSQVPSKVHFVKPEKSKSMNINQPKEHHGLFCMTRQDHVSVR